MSNKSGSIYSRTGIYGIRNKINNHVYIGKTSMNFGDRWDSHKSLLRNNKHFNNYLQNAWNKYGENNFEFIVVEECSNEQINERERYYIKLYRDQGLSYNIADGGEGGGLLGKHLSEETKKKIGEKNRIHMLGRKASEETKQKMSQSHKDRYAEWTDEDRKAWGKLSSETARGYQWSDDSKKKMLGNKNGSTHTKDEILEIRRLHEQEKMSCREIADYLNTTYGFIYPIITYRRWADI